MLNRGTARCLAAAVLFGASAPAASRLAGSVPTLVLAGLLYLGAAAAVAPVALRAPQPIRSLRAGGRRLGAAVVFGGALGPALLMAGLVRIPAAEASLLLNFELVTTAVVASVVFREHLGGRMLGAIALIVGAGAVLVGAPGSGSAAGALLVVCACLCWGIDNAATAGIDRLSPARITFAKGLVAGAVNLGLGLLLTGAAGTDLVEVGAALAIGGLGYGCSIALWVSGARDLGAARGQAIFAAAPFVGAVISWTVLGESASGGDLLAVALAAAGVLLSLNTAHEHVHVHAALEHEHEHAHDDGHHDHLHEDPVVGRHSHRHRHEPMVHAHPHVPDLHHRHRHRT